MPWQGRLEDFTAQLFNWTWTCGCSWRFGLSPNYEFLTPSEAKGWKGKRCDRCDLGG